jgi:hypothetical protein
VLFCLFSWKYIAGCLADGYVESWWDEKREASRISVVGVRGGGREREESKIKTKKQEMILWFHFDEMT